jgi:hypothetical protein
MHKLSTFQGESLQGRFGKVRLDWAWSKLLLEYSVLLRALTVMKRNIWFQ